MTQENVRSSNNSDSVDKLLARNGGLTYLEIPAADAEQSAAFYEAVLGWKIDRTDPKHFKFMDQTGHLLGRWRMDRPTAPEPGLLPYIYLDQLAEAVSQVGSAWRKNCETALCRRKSACCHRARSGRQCDWPVAGSRSLSKQTGKILRTGLIF